LAIRPTHDTHRRQQTSLSLVRRLPLLAVLLLCVPIGVTFCASPVVLSGGDLPPNEQGHLRAGRGVDLLGVNGNPTNERWLIVEPGRYSVHVLSELDAESVNISMAGIIDTTECRDVKINVAPGEEIFVSSRMKTGPSKFSGGYSQFGFHNEISIKSSIEGRDRLVNTSKCDNRYDCSRANRKYVVVKSCE